MIATTKRSSSTDAHWPSSRPPCPPPTPSSPPAGRTSPRTTRRPATAAEPTRLATPPTPEHPMSPRRHFATLAFAGLPMIALSCASERADNPPSTAPAPPHRQHRRRRRRPPPRHRRPRVVPADTADDQARRLLLRDARRDHRAAHRSRHRQRRARCPRAGHRPLRHPRHNQPAGRRRHRHPCVNSPTSSSVTPGPQPHRTRPHRQVPTPPRPGLIRHLLPVPDLRRHHPHGSRHAPAVHHRRDA